VPHRRSRTSAPTLVDLGQLIPSPRGSSENRVAPWGERRHAQPTPSQRSSNRMLVVAAGLAVLLIVTLAVFG
jgi:hypothetical protein